MNVVHQIVCVVAAVGFIAGCSTKAPVPSEVTVLTNLQGLQKIQGPEPTLAVPGCTVEVGREAATEHHHAGLQRYVQELNDSVRALTGLPMDIFVGEEGKYVINCTQVSDSSDVVLDASTGAAMIPYYQTHGMRPENYFSTDMRPDRGAKMSRAVQLLPPPAVPGMTPSVAAAIGQVPEPSFAFDPLLSVVPDSTVAVGSGVYQINNVIRVETQFQPATNASGVLASIVPGETLLHVQHTGVAYPLTCQWAGRTCMEPASPIQDRCLNVEECFMEPLRALVAKKQSRNEPITAYIFDELLGTDPSARQIFDADGTSRMRFTTDEDAAGINLLIVSGLVEASGGGFCSLIPR